MTKFLVPLIAFLLSWASCSPLTALGNAVVGLVRRAPPPTSWSTILRTVPWNVKQIEFWGKIPGTLPAPAEFLNTEGNGVRVYVMDTGIFKDHLMFQGTPVVDFKNQVITPYCGNQESVVDELGHGTSVASIIRSIARQSTLVNVKIQCATRPVSTPDQITQAFNDIIAEHNAFKAGQGTPPGWRGSVINISISTFIAAEITPAWRTAVKAAIAAGIPVISSSGNVGNTMGLPYPCSETGVICNSVSDNLYNLPATGNFGPGIAFTAPGVKIVTAGLPIDEEDLAVLAVRTGSSFSNPHVAAIAAYYVGFEGINNNVAAVLSRLNSNAQTLSFATVNNTFITSPFPNLGLTNPARNPQFPYVGYDIASGPTQFNPLAATVEPVPVLQILIDLTETNLTPDFPETPMEIYVGGIGP